MLFRNTLVKKLIAFVVVVLFFLFVRPDEPPQMWITAMLAIAFYESLQIKGEKDHEEKIQSNSSERDIA